MGALEGRVALVTGGSRGIGRASALALAAAGAKVAVLARDPSAGERTAGEIRRHGGQACAVAADVVDYAAVAAAVAAAESALGPLDILVNNAGVIAPIALLADTDPAAWEQNIRVNLVGAYNVVRAVLPALVSRASGTIVNLSSGAAHHPLEGWSAYAAAKAGLAMLTRSIALEAGSAGVRVFGFGPGTTDTDMQATIRASGLNRVSRIRRADLIPVAEPAAAIVYLCTPAADDLNGREIDLRDPNFRGRLGRTR